MLRPGLNPGSADPLRQQASRLLWRLGPIPILHSRTLATCCSSIAIYDSGPHHKIEDCTRPCKLHFQCHSCGLMSHQKDSWDCSERAVASAGAFSSNIHPGDETRAQDILRRGGKGRGWWRRQVSRAWPDEDMQLREVVDRLPCTTQSECLPGWMSVCWRRGEGSMDYLVVVSFNGTIFVIPV